MSLRARPTPRVSFSALRLALAGVTVASAASLVAGDASAAWPPAETATCEDLKQSANWPSDPGYAYRASASSSQRESGQWDFYCFLPDRSPNSPPVRAGETSSGMSVDLAWRHTIGDPRVKIAVLDSGIKWDEDDLINKAFLSTAELAAHKPHDKDGNACGGTGPLAGFDCDGDGVLTMRDYALDPALLAVVGGASCHSPGGGTGTKLAGDKNDNCVLDPGDLIELYSDGVDDDGNGYVDDISGWDFLHDDNDPYDDTRYGHGTGEARDSSAEANNGRGDAGACPQCRFVPLRVGDSFIADVQDFAQAVIYATDNGVSIVQEALGTIDNSTYTKDALTYAYDHGVTVVASMADENSRHHNLPAANNHTLPAHAITMAPKEEATQAVTYEAFNLCTNYGAQNYLSVSATTCSSGAVGRLSGMSGLVYAASYQYLVDQGKPALSAGEVYQIFLSTADDIDVAESRQAGSPYFWSQPGFDQRFGYGRVNANSAVEAVKNGRIPPAVDIVSPEWFEVLYKDRVTGPVAIRGTISAPRAASYDYLVEAAPGVEPTDAEFKKIGGADNIAGATITGASDALAQLDIHTFDLTHTRDRDSQRGENDYTVTVRVRAKAHYGGTIGDVDGELRRAYAIHSDPDLMPGFPISLGSSGESSPKLADLDGDGVRDIVIGTADGKVHAYSIKSGSPAELAGFPAKVGRITGLRVGQTPSYLDAPAYKSGAIDPDVAGGAIVPTVAIGDVDGDGKPEIVAATWEGEIAAFRSDGTMAPGFPLWLPDVPSCPRDPSKPVPPQCSDVHHITARGAFASPVLADMNKDGKLDIVQAAFDGKVYVYGGDGAVLDGWPVLVHYTGKLAGADEYNRILSTPVVTDFNGDGYPDVLVGSNEKLGAGGQAGAFYLIDGDRQKAGATPYLPNWPVTMASFDLFPVVAEGVPNSPAAGDFDGDGKPEAVMHGNVTAPLIVPTDPGEQSGLSGNPTHNLPCHPDPNYPDDATKTTCGVYPASIFGELSKASTPNTMLPLFSMPSVGDVNQDGTPDVVASGGSLKLAISLQAKSGGESVAGDPHLLAAWDGKTGAMLPGSPYILEDYTFFNNQAIADLNGDDYPEIITGSGGYFVHAYDGCGREPEGWPKFMGQWMISTTAVGDIDGDHGLEVVSATRAGFLYAWHTKGKDDGVIAWEGFHHDNANTGSFGTKLAQGVTKKAAKPLDCTAVVPADAGTDAATPDAGDDADVGPTPTEDVGGGCGCSVPRSSSNGSLWLAALGLGALVVARRRKQG